MGLTTRRKVFIEEYVKCFNAAEAARRAGYSVKTARSIGQALLTNIDVSEAIKQRLLEAHMGADEVLKLLADMARGDLGSFMDVSTVGWNIDLLQRDENGELVHDEKGNVIKKPETKLIKKIKQKVTTFIGKKEDSEDREIVETEIELYDAQAALEKIGKVHGLFVERQDITSGGEKITFHVVHDDDERLFNSPPDLLPPQTVGSNKKSSQTQSTGVGATGGKNKD